MSNTESKNLSLGEELFDMGWKQGTLFVAPSACFNRNKLSNPETGETIIQKNRKTESSEKFILITQDCDFVASDEDEPYCEAVLCKHDKPKFVKKIKGNSTRRFVIDYDAGLVAYAMYRTQFDKKVLKILKPEPWPNGPKRLDEFVRWLARRYDRPAIPDAMYKGFQGPIDAEIALLEKEKPDVFAVFNKVVSDIRVNLPVSEEPPFDLQLILLVNADGLSDEEDNAINIFKDIIHDCIDQETVHLDPEIRILTEEFMSLKEFYATRPIYVADYTYRGEEIDGAPPHGRN